MATRATALRPSPCFYATERRRTLADRVRALEHELAGLDPADFRADVAGYERELALAALEPVTFGESWEDVRYAWRGLCRQVFEAVRK